MSTDTQFRDRVRCEAIANGWSADAAAGLARHVGRRPPTGAPAPSHRASATRAHSPAPRVPSTRDGRVDALCRLYGAQVLAPDFKAARGIPLRAFAALLNEAVGARAKITAPGIEHVRMALMARSIGGAA